MANVSFLLFATTLFTSSNVNIISSFTVPPSLSLSSYASNSAKIPFSFSSHNCFHCRRGALNFGWIPSFSSQQQQQQQSNLNLHQDDYIENSNDDETDEDKNFYYDDFGDFFIGSNDGDTATPSSPSVEQNDLLFSAKDDNVSNKENETWMNKLNERLNDFQSSQEQRQLKLQKNWSTGNWNVRGFALDKNDPTTLDDDGIIDDGQQQQQRRILDGSDSSNSAEATGASYPTSFLQSSPQQEQSKQEDQQYNDENAAFNNDTPPIYISKIASDQSLHNPDIIAVGRTDGTVVLVKLGTRYLTRFTSIPKIVFDEAKWAPEVDNGMEQNEQEKNSEEDNDDQQQQEEWDNKQAEENAPRLKFDSELIDSQELAEQLFKDGGKSGFVYPQDQGKDDERGKRSPYNYSQEEEEEDVVGEYEMEVMEQLQQQANEGIPFKILHQFRAFEKDETIASLLYHDNMIYVSGGISGDVKVWQIQEDVVLTMDDNQEGQQKKGVIPMQTLNRAHSNQIVCLKTLSSSNKKRELNDYDDEEEEHDLLLSASLDGSFALWDLRTGDLVHRCQLTSDHGEDVSIQCADVDTSKEGESHVMYFGLNTGHVVGYCVKDVIASAGMWEEDTCPIPSCSFMAYETNGKEGFVLNDIDEGMIGGAVGMKGVTSILCAGNGLISSGGVGTSSIVTGGSDGTVKQWEIMERKIPSQPTLSPPTPEIKLEHWPRLSTQRMKQCAHLFEGHCGSITSLACVDRTKVLSAGADGTVRIWDRSEGKELYRMDGFTSKISSLCLEENRLITDGMEEYVCLHDFEVDEIEEGKDYNLEDDW
uniref:Anaphase-promoting complex subunit 4 WD40 domain-containing protein n=3 Tax=Ditylum brightwellii TaxID=49249 RepID=A0A7S4W063_9STRA|mmetsp:Transcript_14662/g.19588  ORF Transcript_14662/g.19588 Transcript_14662/m.19588 type:complete len:816 (+) Transcript_14662:311-2758(+)